ncbi:IS1380 family transposase [candidate division KSB1 bacterium]|nr:IS1380 family transposase [candidate division KSB1 bacterium]
MNSSHVKSSNKNQVAIPNFKIEQSQKIDITANAGTFLFAELTKRLDIIDSFAKLQIFERKRIGEAVHIFALVLNQFTGGDAITDTKNIKRDDAFRTIFGDIHIPAPHTSGDFLERFTKEKIDTLRAILWKMQEKSLKKLSKRLQRKIIISLDSSIYEVYGNCKENSSQSYKNLFGFYPLLLHIQHTGELLDIVFRAGAEFTATGADTMLEQNIVRLKPYFDEIILLADSGFFDKKIIQLCEREDINIKFIITSELNQPIRRKLTSADTAWREPINSENDAEVPAGQRNSNTMNHRLLALKTALKKHGKALKIRGELEVAEFQHTVSAWGKQYRFVFKRQRIKEQNLTDQANFFENTEEFFYHGYVTNIHHDDATLESIIQLIDSRGHQENFIKDFKRGLGTVHIPTKHFFGNYTYFLISMLSWNLKCWLMDIIEPGLHVRWKRFRYLVVKVGAQIIKTGSYVVIRFGKGFGRVDDFRTWFSRLQAFNFA